MKIAVISDTHNNDKNLTKALQEIDRRGIATIIHCGDVTGPEILEMLGDRDVYLVYGNIDRDLGPLSRTAREQFGEERFGRQLRVELGGRAVGICHGHDDALDELTRDEALDFVFHGHTHRRKDEQVGGVRVVNPGALGGLKAQSRSFCVVDFGDDGVEFVQV